MGGDVALHEQGATSRIQPRREQDAGGIECLATEHLRVDRKRQRMEVNDAEVGVGGILVQHPVAHSTEVVAQMKVPGGLDSGKYARHGRRC